MFKYALMVTNKEDNNQSIKINFLNIYVDLSTIS